MKDKSTNLKNTSKKNSSANHTKKKKRRKVKLSQKGLATIVIFVLILLAILITLISSFVNKNSIDRVYNKLNLSIGKSISEIEKTTKVEFNQSASSDTLSNLIKFNYIAEPTVTTKVCGTSLPKWVAYAKVNKSGNTTHFTIYDFTILEDSILGVKVKEPPQTDTLIGTSDDTLIDTLGIKPYIYLISQDDSKQYIFRYYYNDSTSFNDVSVQMVIDIDTNGTVTDVSTNEINFISDVLSTQEVTTASTTD